MTPDLLTFFCLAKKKVTKKRRDQNLLPYALAEASPHFGQASPRVTLRHTLESTHSILEISVEDNSSKFPINQALSFSIVTSNASIKRNQGIIINLLFPDNNGL
jgi:hypothetical protein